jgi:hydrogenase maturation protease
MVRLSRPCIGINTKTQAMPDQRDILILGLGSEILRDDGIGPRLARDLGAHFTSKAFKFNTSTVGGLEIIDLIKGFKIAFIIDGMKSEKINPGQVLFMNQDNFQETLHLSNIHDASFHTALRLGNEIDAGMPPTIHIIGIGVEEDTEFGETFTKELDRQYVDILKMIHQFIVEQYKSYRLSTPLDTIKGD